MHAEERIDWPGAVCHCLKECKTQSAKTEHCCLIREEFVSEEAKGLANTLAIQLCFANKTTGMQGSVSSLCDHDRDADSMSVWSRLPRVVCGGWGLWGLCVGWGGFGTKNIMPPLPPPQFHKQHTIIKTHRIHVGISGILFPVWSLSHCYQFKLNCHRWQTSITLAWGRPPVDSNEGSFRLDWANKSTLHVSPTDDTLVPWTTASRHFKRKPAVIPQVMICNYLVCKPQNCLQGTLGRGEKDWWVHLHFFLPFT